MFRAIPKNVFSWNFSIWQGDRRIGELDFAWLRERGRLQIADTVFQLNRQGLWSGDFTLEHDGAVLARANKPNPFRRYFDLEFEGRAFVLKAFAPITRSFGLYQGDTPIGTIQPDYWLLWKTTIDLPDEIPVPVQLFAFWLVVLMWRRQSKQAAS